MATKTEIEARFWKALKADMTIMVGLPGIEDGEAQPMTAQLGDDGKGPIWFFTAKDTDLAKALTRRRRGVMHFASKGHDLFATLHGQLVRDNDRATIDRLWNPFVAAWFKGGKEDPNLQLVRFDPGRAQVWLNEHSLFAGVKMLLGSDPKSDYRKKVAVLELS